MPTAEEVREFIVAVVNADERVESEGTRKRFSNLYRDWFPEELEGHLAKDHLQLQLTIHYMPQMASRMWWCRSSVEGEQPTTWFGLHVAVWRDRFQAIWQLASEKNLQKAKALAGDLLAEMRQYRRPAKSNGSEPWRVRTLAACEWLAQALSRLRICKNPGCSERRYFIRDEKDQKYCSPLCADRGHELLRLERIKASGVKPKRVLSPEAREAIAKAQRERHAKTRAANKEKAGLV